MSLIENKKAHLNFEFVEEFEAGIELFGHEVKSIKNKQGSLEGSFVVIRGNEAFLLNVFIPPYQAKNTPESYDPYRNRRLLLTKKEIAGLNTVENKKGLTIIPISMYNKSKLIKVRLAVVRGKKKHDKRESIKKRDVERDIRRTLKNE